MKSERNMRFLFKNVDVEEKTREYILKRLDKVEKILENILQEEVEIEKDKIGQFRVEIMIKTPYKLYRAEETTESIEGSADLAVDSLKIQINRERDKRKTLIERGNRSIKKKNVLDENARF